MTVREAWRMALSTGIALAAVSLVGCGGSGAPPAPVPVAESDADAAAVEDAAAEPAESSDDATAQAPAVAEETLDVKHVVDGEGYDLSFGTEIGNLKAGTARATISAPKGWELPIRRPEYLIYFVEKRGKEFPRVVVTTEPAPAGTSDTTEANVADLAVQVGETVNADEKTLETVKPMVVGGVPCVRYVSSAKARSGAIEEQVLKTVQGGQLFTVNLQAEVDPAKPDEGLVKYRDAGYAVMASLSVVVPPAPPAEASPAETPATDAPPAEAAATPGS